jgi:hypothetical protein
MRETRSADVSNMDQSPHEGRAMRRNGYQNAMLTAIAVLLALGLVERHTGTVVTEPASVSAQPEPDQGGMTNRLEQGKQQIIELRAISAKLDHLDAKLSAGINVKVTSMPPIQVNEKREKNEKKGNAEDAPAPAPVVQPSAPKPAGK